MTWTTKWRQTQPYSGVIEFLEDGEWRFSMAIDKHCQNETAEVIVKMLNKAVAAEREACAAKVKECAENALQKKNLPCRYEAFGALIGAAAAILARGGEGEQVER